jgi:hypothetical protein
LSCECACWPVCYTVSPSRIADIDALSSDIIEQIQPIVSNAHFSPDAVGGYSPVCAYLCAFVKAAYAYHQQKCAGVAVTHTTKSSAARKHGHGHLTFQVAGDDVPLPALSPPKPSGAEPLPAALPQRVSNTAPRALDASTSKAFSDIDEALCAFAALSRNDLSGICEDISEFRSIVRAPPALDRVFEALCIMYEVPAQSDFAIISARPLLDGSISDIGQRLRDFGGWYQ